MWKTSNKMTTMKDGGQIETKIIMKTYGKWKAMAMKMDKPAIMILTVKGEENYYQCENDQ
jgi:hypothetical protein